MQQLEVINILKKNLNFTNHSVEKLKKFTNLVLKENKNYNLIAKSTENQIWSRHILDSAQLVKLIDFNLNSLADLGSGAGFPGIVIDIFNKNKAFHVKLYEKSRVKRRFLKGVIKELDLNAEVLGTGTNSEKLDKLKANFSKIKTKKFDISSHSKIEKFIDEASEELKGLDVLVNNAGINRDNLSLRMKEEEWQKVIDVNLSSTFLLSKYAIKKMLKSNSGRVINITSIVGHTGNIGQSNYAASKAGTIGMSKSLSIEYAKKNITINCVSPGFIVSDMTNSIPEKIKSILLSKIPMGKMGSGDDVSNCVAFLSSDEAAYITGETIHVNGGMYMA